MFDLREVEFVIVIIGLGDLNASWRVREKEKKMVVCVTWHFRNPNLRKKKQVKKKIFDNILNFASKSSLRVTIWDNLSRWIVYVTLKLPTMHLTNGITFKFNGNDYFAKPMQRYGLFLTFQKDRD